jgi:endonuclease YncB( thermonuclease family)
VVDGDTFAIGGQDIRLIGLDAPEGRQTCQRSGRPWRCGEAATAALRGTVRGGAVECQVYGRDRYQRPLAVCRVGGVELNREMVRQGWAVAYHPARGVSGPSYASKAEAAQRGIWAGTFTAPADWRAGRQ